MKEVSPCRCWRPIRFQPTILVYFHNRAVTEKEEKKLAYLDNGNPLKVKQDTHSLTNDR